MPLPVRMDARRYCCVAVRVEADIGTFIRWPGGLFDGIDDTETANLAACFRLSPARVEIGIVNLVRDSIDVCLELCAVLDVAKRCAVR
jgi:hypothetical protein